jgi:hypothetical protein
LRDFTQVHVLRNDRLYGFFYKIVCPLKGKWFNVAGNCRRNVRASVNHTDAYFARRALPSRRLVPFQEANRARAKPSFYGAVRPKRLLLRMISPRHFSSGAWSLMGILDLH